MTMSVFHSKHGRGVTLVGDGRTARRTGGGGSRVLFSGAPLQSQVVWTIKVEEIYAYVSFIVLTCYILLYTYIRGISGQNMRIVGDMRNYVYYINEYLDIY